VLTMSNIAVEKAKKIVREYGERNADRLARDLGIIVLPRPFKHQKGAYKIIERNRFVFIKEDLEPIMRAIVLLHEIGHDALHRKEAIACGGFQEFTLFDMRDKRIPNNSGKSTVSDFQVRNFLFHNTFRLTHPKLPFCCPLPRQELRPGRLPCTWQESRRRRP